MKPYHYTECGLDNVYLVNGFEITKNKKDEEIFIRDIHGLHKMIGMTLVNKPGLLSGKEVRFIRTTLDFSQKRLANLLGCTYQTVLLWEKNKTPISKTADRLLRSLFSSYLHPNADDTIYNLINRIADFNAEIDGAHRKKEKILFKEASAEWQLVLVKQKRRLGTAKGMFTMADDFNAPLVW